MYILMDGAAVVLYLYLIARMADSYQWLYKLGIPIVACTVIVVEFLMLAFRRFPKGILPRGLYLFTGLAILCVGYEIIIDLFNDLPIGLGWSAVVLTICIIVGIAIVTTLSRRRLRNEIRRRLHF